jgi:hypothetical protein
METRDGEAIHDVAGIEDGIAGGNVAAGSREGYTWGRANCGPGLHRMKGWMTQGEK